MKTQIYSLSFIAGIAMLTSGGVSNSFILNHNTNTMQVQLSANNFKVVNQMS